MRSTEHKFVNILMGKAEGGIPRYRKMAVYFNSEMNRLNELDVVEADYLCPKCDGTVQALNINGVESYHCCVRLTCDYGLDLFEDSHGFI